MPRGAHGSLTRVIRGRAARLLFLANAVLFLLQYRALLDPPVLLLLILALVVLLGIVGVRLLATATVLVLVAAGGSTLTRNLALADRLATLAYYLLLLLAIRQVFRHFLSVARLGRTACLWGQNLEAGVYRSLGEYLGTLLTFLVAAVLGARRLAWTVARIVRATAEGARRAAARVWPRAVLFARTAVRDAVVRVGVRALASITSGGRTTVEQGARGTAAARDTLRALGLRLRRIPVFSILFGPLGALARAGRYLLWFLSRVLTTVVASVASGAAFVALPARRAAEVWSRASAAIPVRARSTESSLARFLLARPVLASLLFAIPFFWFRYGEGDFGGDSSRLYFLDPGAWITTKGLNPLSNNAFGTENPNYFLLPFLLLLRFLQGLFFGQSAFILPVFNGALLAGAFLATDGIIRELAGGKGTVTERLAGVGGAAFYVFSHLLMYNWPKAPYTFHQIAVYPAVLWCFFRFQRNGRLLPLLGAVLLSGVFAVNFSVWAAPSLLAFWPFAGVLLLGTAALARKVRRLAAGLAVFGVLFLSLHAFHLFPQLAALRTAGNVLVGHTTPAGREARGVRYFEALRPPVHLLYNLVGFHQLELYAKTGAPVGLVRLMDQYGARRMVLFFAVPLIVFLATAVVHREADRGLKARFLLVLALFLFAAFAVTANLFGEIGPAVYRSLIRTVPGFAVFRSFVGVFAIPFAFLYALVLGLALRILLLNQPRLPAAVILGPLLFVLLWSATPFLRGEIFRAALADSNEVPLAHRIPPTYRELLSWMREQPLQARVLTLPLTEFDYEVVAGPEGGAYIGPSPFGLLAGKPTISGVGGFEEPRTDTFRVPTVRSLLAAGNRRNFGSLLDVLSVGFLVVNEEPRAYRSGFFGWPYSRDVFAVFPAVADVSAFASQLGEEVYASGAHRVFARPQNFRPLLTIARRVRRTSGNPGLKLADLSPTGRRSPAPTVLLEEDRTDVPEALPSGSTLEFRQLQPTTYRLRVRGLSDRVPLVFNAAFHAGWRLFPVPGAAAAFACRTGEVGKNDSLFVGAAPPATRATWCRTGRLSSAGPAFVSQDFFGTVQNDNLPRGPLWETWKLRPLPEELHVRANEYANAWWLDLPLLEREFPSVLRKNPGGSADLELLLEFTPQRWFYVGAAVSLLTLWGVLGWLAVSGWRHRGRFARHA